LNVSKNVAFYNLVAAGLGAAKAARRHDAGRPEGRRAHMRERLPETGNERLGRAPLKINQQRSLAARSCDGAVAGPARLC
jgi:hypothetical protein